MVKRRRPRQSHGPGGCHSGRALRSTDIPVEAEQRFWRHIYRRNGDSCWPWQGPSSCGSGLFPLPGRFPVAAHRVSYVVFKGDIPAGALVLHNCHNSICVRPSHLRLGTPKDNMRDRKFSREGLKAWRKRMSWTQKQAAEWYGVSRASWTHWESGRYPIPMPLIRRLQAGLDKARVRR
jgi:DNA-binding XRE family transcriptional regulator